MTDPIPPDEPTGAPLAPTPPAPPGTTPAPSANTVARGALCVLAGHALAILLIAIFNGSQFAEAALIAFFFVGLYQWVYVLPLAIWAHATRRHQLAKGAWILAGVSILPTATCFGFVSQMGF